MSVDTHISNTYCVSENVVTRQVAGETWLVPISGKLHDRETLYALNESGQIIWQALQKPCTLEEMTSVLMNEYEIDETTAQQDIQEQLQDLLDLEFITLQS